jgi:glycosyltransferase involved in cell wall biosynthesis
MVWDDVIEGRLPMPKIFVVSLHRSATQSTGRFLREAGFTVCDWLGSVGGVDYQSQAIGHEIDRRGIVQQLEPPFAQYEAFKDVPLPVLYRELEAVYPDARFIAVRRDPADWVRSVRAHCAGRLLDPYERVQYWHYLTGRPISLAGVDDARLVEMHARHYRALAEHFAGRGNFLLVELADPRIGARMAAFLGVPSRAFPHVDLVGFSASDPQTPAAAPAPSPAPLDPKIRSRFHILGIPHTLSVPEYSVCAFTTKVVRLCALLKSRGHTVIHYGHKDSNVACDEHVSVTDDEVLRRTYGDHDWRSKGFPNFAIDDFAYKTFYANTIAAIERRQQPGDFLLCMFGAGHKAVADGLKDLIVCEPGIGYPGGHFAPFKVFESYAMLHAFGGLDNVARMNNGMWYDVVIPNYYDLDDFEYSEEKEDYFLFLGRIGGGKGVHIAMQIAEATGDRLVVAGPGSIDGMGTRTNRPVSEYVECVGVAGVELRKRLMAKAKGMLLPSTYVEPFCGVHIESMLSGTPVITTDWGAFTEYNLHGITGYRCRTFEQFVWAARNIGGIQPAACRDWAAANFAMDRVADMYDEYFYSIKNVASGAGWYADNPFRTELDGLNRHYPSQAPGATPASG